MTVLPHSVLNWQQTDSILLPHEPKLLYRYQLIVSGRRSGRHLWSNHFKGSKITSSLNTVPLILVVWQSPTTVFSSVTVTTNKKSQQWWQSLWLIQSSTDLRYTITTSVLGTLFKLLCLPPFFFLLKASRQSVCSYEVIQVFRFSLFSLHYCSVFTIKYKTSWCHFCCCDL